MATHLNKVQHKAGKTSKKKLHNNFGILEWEFEEPSKAVNFLDLTISIENEKISTKTFQKAMNLYQYLSPRSNHPPGMIKGIIYSLLKTYKNQNTHTEDYLDIVIKLAPFFGV